MEYTGHRIQKFDAEGNFILKFGTQGRGDGQFIQPSGGVVDTDGNIYIADRVNHRIQKFNSEGIFIKKWGSRATGLYYPTGLALDSAENLYVAGHWSGKVHKYDREGNFITEWSTGTHAPVGIAIDSSDNVYTVAWNQGNVYKQTTSGTLLTSWGNFNYVHGVSVDDKGSIYITDTRNHRMLKYGTPILEIEIDIKPDSTTNSVNINGHGTIPVALLGAEDFDVTEVDRTSLLFANLKVRIKGKKSPQCAIEETNGDTYPDLVCHFIDNKERFTSEDNEAILTGILLDGTAIEGNDFIYLHP